MSDYFSKLGRDVYERWQEADFSLDAFPGIASKTLRERPPSKHVDADSLIRDFLLNDWQPFQTTSGFGQPELIVHDNPKFYIQVLFWLDGTTDIHQHGFSGAFHVMSGSSIHSVHRFDDEKPVTPHLSIGNLIPVETRLLETGTTHPILSGRGCIHALFHLETPSVTVVVRTHSDPAAQPQFTYLPPHVAVDPLHHDALTIRRKQLLDLLEQVGDDSYPELVLEMIRALDLERGFFVLQNCITHLRNLGAWELVWKAFVKKHGPVANRIGPTLDEIIRRDGLVAMRNSIEDVEHRFFLALLLNVPERKQLLSLIGERFPGNPLKTIARWAAELIHTTETGTWLLDAGLPPDSRFDEEDYSAVILAALGHFLAPGRIPPALRPLSKKELASLRETFAASSWRTLLPPAHGAARKAATRRAPARKG